MVNNTVVATFSTCSTLGRCATCRTFISDGFGLQNPSSTSILKWLLSWLPSNRVRPAPASRLSLLPEFIGEYPCCSREGGVGNIWWRSAEPGETGHLTSLDTTCVQKLQCTMINCLVSLLMQDRGSNVAAFVSLQANLSSVPTPALLDPGCANREKQNYIHHKSSISVPQKA